MPGAALQDWIGNRAALLQYHVCYSMPGARRGLSALRMVAIAAAVEVESGKIASRSPAGNTAPLRTPVPMYSRVYARMYPGTSADTWPLWATGAARVLLWCYQGWGSIGHCRQGCPYSSAKYLPSTEGIRVLLPSAAVHGTIHPWMLCFFKSRVCQLTCIGTINLTCRYP